MRRLAFICVCLIVVSGDARAQSATEADSFRQSQDYLQTLAAFEEPSINPGVAGKAEVIRVIVWPTFESPVTVRVEARGGEKYQLIAKRLKGDGGYQPGPVNKAKRRKLRRAEWDQLQSLLAKAGFWSMATEEDERFAPQPDGSQMMCLDGTNWTVEVISNRGYHAVQRYCPKEGSFTAIGQYMVKLSKLGINKRWL